MVDITQIPFHYDLFFVDINLLHGPKLNYNIDINGKIVKKWEISDDLPVERLAKSLEEMNKNPAVASFVMFLLIEKHRKTRDEREKADLALAIRKFHSMGTKS